MAKLLQGKGSSRFSQERAELDARYAELRKREEQLAVQQRLLIGSVVLGLVESGEWTERQLHEFLRPHLKRRKDFLALGMTPASSTPAALADDLPVLDSEDDQGANETASTDATASPSNSLFSSPQRL